MTGCDQRLTVSSCTWRIVHHPRRGPAVAVNTTAPHCGSEPWSVRRVRSGSGTRALLYVPHHHHHTVRGEASIQPNQATHSLGSSPSWPSSLIPSPEPSSLRAFPGRNFPQRSCETATQCPHHRQDFLHTVSFSSLACRSVYVPAVSLLTCNTVTTLCFACFFLTFFLKCFSFALADRRNESHILFDIQRTTLTSFFTPCRTFSYCRA